MAFRKAIIEIKPASIGTGIKATLRASKKLLAQLNLTLTDATVKKLAWSDQDRIEVMIGEGPHHGILRLRKNNSVGQARLQKTQTGKGPFFTLRLGHQADFPRDTQTAAWCMWEEIEEDGQKWVEVCLPSWADKTAPKQSNVVVNVNGALPKGPHERAKAFGSDIARRG